jgi:hypothetical protein
MEDSQSLQRKDHETPRVSSLSQQVSEHDSRHCNDTASLWTPSPVFYLAVPRWGFGETNGFVQPTWLLESAWDCISLPRILNACLVNSQPLNPRSPFATLFISQEKFNRCTNFAIFCSDVKKEELAVSAETGRSQPGQPIGQNFALGELLLDQALAERIPLLQPCSF